MFGPGIHSPEDRRFVGLAAGVVDDILARDPVHATRIGDHRFDARLPDRTAEGNEEFARVLVRHQASLESVDALALSRVAAADLQVLRAGVAARVFELTQIRAAEWDPLLWDPGDALYQLLARSFAPVSLRARSLIARLLGVPEFLDSARQALTDMPAVHVTTAIARLRSIEPMLAELLGDLREVPEVAASVGVAVQAIHQHIGWLSAQSSEARRNPALGPELYGAALRQVHGVTDDVDDVLADAEEALESLLDDLGGVSATYLRGSMADSSVVTDALELIASQSRVNDDNVLDVAAEALAAAAAFADEQRLVTVPEIDVRLEPMPAVHRGVSVAYCDAPGPMDRADLPTVVAIAPTPADWAAPRRASFYREYNRQLIHNLMVHEGIPGHVLQLTRARSVQAPSGVRGVFPSGMFIEGWAVYAEELMADRGFAAADSPPEALRIQQLKMQVRTVINTILDIRVHTRGMTEAEARRLMATKGFQEEGEIVGKWNRARLTHGQLTTYYLGYLGVAQVVEDLARRNRTWNARQVHDTVLAHGSVAPEVLRPLVGLE